MSTSPPFSGWVLVELMGHRRRAGQVREVEQFGVRQLRVDIPVDTELGFVSEYYGGAAIYGVHPCTEDVASAYAKSIGDPRPVAPVSFRLPAPEPAATDGEIASFDLQEDDDV